MLAVKSKSRWNFSPPFFSSAAIKYKTLKIAKKIANVDDMNVMELPFF